MGDIVDELRYGHEAATLWHVAREAANEIEALRAENAELKKAGREVVDWWLRDGMNKFDGAPAAMFSLRAAIGDE